MGGNEGVYFGSNNNIYYWFNYNVCNMKKTFFSMLIMAFIAISCTNGSQKEVQYKKHMSHNKAYEVYIPVNYSQEAAIGDMLQCR